MTQGSMPEKAHSSPPYLMCLVDPLLRGLIGPLKIRGSFATGVAVSPAWFRELVRRGREKEQASERDEVRIKNMGYPPRDVNLKVARLKPEVKVWGLVLSSSLVAALTFLLDAWRSSSRSSPSLYVRF